MKHWADKEQEEEDKKKFRHGVSPSSYVERTAYAAMAYMRTYGDSDISRVIEILKWLIQQQTATGGYSSTQVWNFGFWSQGVG